MKTSKLDVTPEGVLFHELGHALHARFARTINSVPEKLADLFCETTFPKYKSLSSKDQSEILADVLGMGLMHGSPFIEYDPFKTIDNVGKEFFSKITEKVLSKI